MKVTVWDAHNNSNKPVFSEGELWLFFSQANSYSCHLEIIKSVSVNPIHIDILVA